MSIFRAVTRAFAALPFLLAAGCFPGGATDPMSNAANMSAQSVPAASSIIGSSAAPAPSVLVTNNGGKPVAGATVTFSVTAGNGSITATSVKTDKQGIASVTWTYGMQPGDNRLVATLGTLPPVAFVVSTTGGGPASIVKENDGQSATVGEALAQPASVVVRDLAGNPVVGVAVQFTALGGSTLGAPHVTTASVATDVAGRAQSAWTMDTVPAAYGLTAAVAGLPAVTFGATAIVGAPFAIATSGDAQTATVNTAVANPLAITVIDRYHNPISGLHVTYAPQGGGSATPATDLTTASGQSTTQWKLPTVAGAAALTVSIDGSSVSATFTATATPGAPWKLEKMASSDNQTGDAGQTLPQDMSVTARDTFENAVPAVAVTFSPASGSVSPQTVATDGLGQANSSWTLGATGGPTTLSVSAVGVADPVVFNATVRAPSADPCASHGTLVVGTTVSGNAGTSGCAFPMRGSKVDFWTLDLSQSTALEVVETMDDPASPDAYLAMYRGAYDANNLLGYNDDIDVDNANYDSHIRFLGGSGHFLVGASYNTWYPPSPDAKYHLVAKRWSGAVTLCQDVFAVSGTSTSQVLDNDDCPPTASMPHADRVFVLLRPGETIVVNMSSTVFDTKLVLQNASGSQLASDDNSGGGTNARLTYTVPATAAALDMYVVYATSAVANAGGNYTFSVGVTTPAGMSAPMRAITPTTAEYSAALQRLVGARRVKTLRTP